MIAKHSFWRLALVLPLLALVLWSNVARAEVLPDQVPNDLKSAIEQKVKAEGKQYAGLCRAIDQSANLGKYCAFVLSLTATEAEVSYGPVLSEPTARITFLKQDGKWVHPGGGPGEGEPGTVPAELRAAIKSHVEGKGQQYAGLCKEIAQDGSTLGKYCAGVTNLTATSATVSYGPVASNAITTVSFKKLGAGWAADGAPSTVIPRPPATGNSTPNDDSSGFKGASVALLGLLLAGVFGLLSTRTHRRNNGAK